MNEGKHCEASHDKKQDDGEVVKQVHLYNIPLSDYKKLEAKAKRNGLKPTPYMRMKLIQIANEKE